MMPKGLDCLTVAGRRWIYHQDLAISVILQAHPTLRALVSEDPAARYDCIFTKGDVPVSVAEVKSREYYTGDIPLTEKMVIRGGYLVTWDKIEKLREKAVELGVPASLIVNLIRECKVLLIKLTDSDGEYRPPIQIKRSVTKATCNGGEIERINAIIYPDADTLRVYSYSSPGIMSIPIS